MGQTNYKKGEEKNVTNSLSDAARKYRECNLNPITLSGVVVPWSSKFYDGTESNFKLVCLSGLEYFFATDEEWVKVLNWYSWEEVKVIGLLNTTNLTIIPQRVFPKGPTGEREKIIDLSEWKSRLGVTQVAKNLGDLIITPVAIGPAFAF